MAQFLELGTLADKLDLGSSPDGTTESTFMRRQKRTKRYQDFYMVRLKAEARPFVSLIAVRSQIFGTVPVVAELESVFLNRGTAAIKSVGDVNVDAKLL